MTNNLKIFLVHRSDGGDSTYREIVWISEVLQSRFFEVRLWCFLAKRGFCKVQVNNMKKVVSNDWNVGKSETLKKLSLIVCENFSLRELFGNGD